MTGKKKKKEEEEEDNDDNEGLWSLDFVSLLMEEISHTVDTKGFFCHLHCSINRLGSHWSL